MRPQSLLDIRRFAKRTQTPLKMHKENSETIAALTPGKRQMEA